GGHPLEVAAIPEPVGGQRRLLGNQALEGGGDLGGARAVGLVALRVGGQLARQLATEVVGGDLEAVVWQQQLEGGVVGLDAAAQELEQVQLVGEALHGERLEAG